jgi:hypothetical protein
MITIQAYLGPPIDHVNGSLSGFDAQSVQEFLERLNLLPTGRTLLLHVGPVDFHDHGARFCLLGLLAPQTGQLRFRDQGTYSGSSATFLGHSLSASCFCISNQAFKRNLCVRTAAAVDC